MVELLPPDVHSTRDETWYAYVRLLRLAILLDIRVGSVFLLVLMTAPLTTGFIAYHLYLIWAGMTTNETAKWSTLNSYVSDGRVFKSEWTETSERSSSPDGPRGLVKTWPMVSNQVIAVTEDGQPPETGRISPFTSNDPCEECDSHRLVDREWIQLRSLRDVDNIYDLGFWDNMLEAAGFSVNHIER